MPKYNPDIHKRRSIRLKGYNYSQEGLYFITVCVQNHKCLFGKIVNGEMQLNETGEIVREEWEKSAEIRKEIEIHEYVIMPNHLHAIAEIVSIDANDEMSVGAYGIRPTEICTNNPMGDGNDSGVCHDNQSGVCHDNQSGVCHTPLRSPSKTLGALVRGFKSSVTKQLGFSLWQRNYYEHIIRNDKSYQHIANYIVNNQINWETDRFFK